MQIEGYSNIQQAYSSPQSLVFYATRDLDKVAVSLKMPTTAFPDPRQLASLKREYQIMQRLEGDGLPQALGFIETKNSAVLVKKWTEGLSLKDYQRSKDIPLVQALKIAIEICRLIGSVHRQSYCHRDISPRNILFNPDTGGVTLIDFCSALEFTNRVRNVVKPRFVEGSRPYMSPEQTGRMNRGLDFRTDFYSLGVVLYELFAKELPFNTTDTNELIHSHIALEPAPLSGIDPSISSVLSDVVLKLMSKDPDNRYQSAEGIRADLENCLEQFLGKKKIESFTLGSADLHDRFIIPERLYGREKETRTLIQTFDSVSQGNGHMVFIAGKSGIGKTSLVQELYRPLAVQGGYIAVGKYDQFLRHQPYSAVLQALGGLVRQIMGENEQKISAWKTKILEGIGANGQVLIEVIPELELLIGPQPPVQKLSMEAASTRFNTAFHNLFNCLGSSESPLVFFLDDVQWIDSSSLALLEALAPTLNNTSFLIIGAYRSNEVSDTHPLMISMPGLRESCPNIFSIELEELVPSVLGQMLDHTLELPNKESQRLSQLLYEKTHGNPLFFKTMLTSLYSGQAIFFDYSVRRWSWDPKAVEAMPHADNVVEMLQSKLTTLPVQTLELLKLAGCIGNIFGLNLLTGLGESSRARVAEALIPAVSKGFIQPMGDDFELLVLEKEARLPDMQFRFSHDRIQQAAYDLVSAEEQERLHWSIGRQLLTEIESCASEQRLFDTVEHLNQGRANAGVFERQMLVDLNLKAGIKAKQAAAFSVAHSCLMYARELLDPVCWDTDYKLAVDVHIELAQACYLVSEFDRAEELYQELREKVHSDRDRLRICNIQAKQYHHQGLYQKSVEYEYEALALLGINLPKDDQGLLEMFGREKEKIQALLKQKDFEQLYHQDEVEDPDYLLTHELCFDTFGDAYLLGRGPLLATVAAISVRLSMERGNCPATSVGYINYATILCSSGEYREGHAIGRLAVRLADKYRSPAFKNYTYHVFSLGINHWLEPLRSSYNYWHEASKLSQESGSPYAGWVFLQLPHVLLASGTHLDEVAKQAEESLHYLTGERMKDIVQLLKLIVLQPLRHLQGKTRVFKSLDDEDFSTAEIMESYQEAPFFLGHTVYSMLRATLLAREIQPKEKLAQWLPLIESTVQAQIIQVDASLYVSLHLAAACTGLEGDEREDHLTAVKEQMARFKDWAALCPANFQHKYLMIKAEVLRLTGDYMGAMDHYDLAREAALNARFLLDAALSDELAGFFWHELGKEYQARIYMKRAMAGYEQWGAHGKVAWMQETYPELVVDTPAVSFDLQSTVSSSLEVEDFSAILDMGSVLKASQAISQHIHLEKLAAELLNLAIENAGATRGVLLLKQDGEYIVTNEINKGKADKGGRGLNISYSESDNLSQAIIRYVINAGRSVVYTPGNHDEQFDRCFYLNGRGTISVLCVPIIRQNKMSGLLYLENTLLADAFQSDRVSTLKVIASQAAISLENAKMYHDLDALNKNLEDLVQERTRKLHEANDQLKEKNQELEILSTTDQLTGLYNRRYAEDQIQSGIEQSCINVGELSVLMLDIDYFKLINDTYGHDVGDEVLVKVATILKENTCKVDVPSRWGGEEFLVLCWSGENGAMAIAEKIRLEIMALDNGVAKTVTASFGITQYQENDTIDTLLKRVDQGLYQAKKSGRNQVCTVFK